MTAAAKPQTSQCAGTEAAPAPGDVIDLAHLRRFTLGDRNLELEILGLFIDQVPASIEALRHARTDQQWTMAAHTLKGSARAVGAWRLAKLAEHAEKFAGPSDPPACKLVLRDLAVAAGEARDQIVAFGNQD